MTMITTPEGINYAQLAALKGAVKLEKLGMRHSSGRSMRKRAAIAMKLKPNASYDEVIAALEKKLYDMLVTAAHKKMTILNSECTGSHRQCGISNHTLESIQQMLGPDVKDQGDLGDGKVTHQWDFTVDGVQCSIWDYKGSARLKHWSFFGPREIAVALFGESNVSKEGYE